MVLMLVISTMVILPLTAHAHDDVAAGPIDPVAPIGYALDDL